VGTFVEFAWDEAKRQKTLEERGIDFIDAARIWLDPRRQERRDTRENYGEERFQTVGLAEFSILFVVYTIRSFEEGREVIRIISARKANKKERELYLAGAFAKVS
jgi:uncharacterized protein